VKVDKVALEAINLVEASAGTGKTYTLTSLYLRLLLELGHGPESILVMTYTNAATAELKTRIRQRLIEARCLFGGGESADPLLMALYDQQPDKQKICRRLDLALAGFDRAAIFTIHGFCQRVLTDYAFECGQTFKTELIPDQSTRLQQIADDFWRREINKLPTLFLEHFRKKIATPEALLLRFKPAVGKPYLQVRSASWPENLEALETQALDEQKQLQTLWRNAHAKLQALLSDPRILKGNAYRKDWVAGWCVKMNQWLPKGPYTEPFDKLERFTCSEIARAVKPGKRPPEHPFFERIDRLIKLRARCIKVAQQAVAALHQHFFQYLCEELPKRQALAGEWYYDDLLLQLLQALKRDHLGQLTGLLRKQYPAALIDEFQDTDPIQYEILEHIYLDSGQVVFLVGDPKQAIYSFRGADIFTYLQAREVTQAKRHTLKTNWRSIPGMVQAINTLFQFSPNPFYDQRIEFDPVAPALRDRDFEGKKGKPGAALHIWRLTQAAQLNTEVLRQSVADATAAEITRLLSTKSTLVDKSGERVLKGSDIAILVRTHEQGARLASTLYTKGIKSVRSSQLSVYWTPEAEAMEQVLMALLEPHRQGLMRAALATPLFGWDAQAIDQLNHDEKALSKIAKIFFNYHQMWSMKGFITMFRNLMLELRIENRLLAYRDGERRLTNLYHLIELCQQHDTTLRTGMEGLVIWFRQQCQSSSADEDRLLRLESDGQWVKIDTLHHSKGLEYGIVFCPYLWDEGLEKNKDTPFLFHDPEQNDAAVLELGSEDFHHNHKKRQQEVLAENLRLLYVGLTRARYRCYLPWGLNAQSRLSALCWLLYSGCLSESSVDITQWRAVAKKLQVKDEAARLEQLSKQGRGSIVISPMPQEQKQYQMSLKLPLELMPARHSDLKWIYSRRVVSFSSLVAGRSEDLPDHDEQAIIATPHVETEQQWDVHSFPKGSGPGSCLHAILEELDFYYLEETTTKALVEEKLNYFGIDTQWTMVVANWMNQVLETPLNNYGLMLRQITSKQRLNEMAFHFPVSAFPIQRVVQLSKRYRFSQTQGLLEGLSNLKIHTVDGFIKGFIDLVFEVEGRYYLADYKSNWLGSDYPDYHQQALYQAMNEHHYPLQYMLYTLALHRYLRLRLPGYDYERHFGGVYYLFLRGMRPQNVPQQGIVAERPSADFIDALDQLVGGNP
jgi:exodeoxyribonuclease V beta subunit